MIGRVTRAVVMLSALLAAAIAMYPSRFFLPLPIFIVAAVAARWFGRFVLPVLLAAAYVTPAASLLLAGSDHYSYALVWLAGLLGVIVGTSAGSDWSVPHSWRGGLIAWALVVAVSWPLVAWRELDFGLAALGATRLPLATMKFAPPWQAGWIAYTALLQLLGLLWIDWLARRWQGSTADDFNRQIVAPLAAAITAACAIAVYQSTVDIGFLSAHAWPSFQRAVGSFVDANVFGMIAALWAPVFVTLAWSKGGRIGGAALAAAVLAIVGVWVSASRTALLTLLVGVVITLAHLAPGALSEMRRRRGLALAGVIAAAILLVVTLSPLKTTSALQRNRYLVPSLTAASIRDTAYQLWDRDGYGTAALIMIRDFPLTGVGIGCFHMLAHDFEMEATGMWIPPDNAQNWFRHQLAELGILGSIGWIAWTVVFLWQLVRPRLAGARSGTALRGPIIGFGFASLIGMAGQDPAVMLTFWVLVYWFAADAGVIDPTKPRGLRRWTWAAILVLVGAYAGMRAVPGQLRPAFRAVRFGFPYSYALVDQEHGAFTTSPNAVTVMSSEKRWLKLTYWIEHPDAATNPVRVQIWRDYDRIVDRKLYTDVRVTRYVSVPGGNKRFVLEVKVDRTFTPAGDTREHGLNLKWEFVDSAPPGVR